MIDKINAILSPANPWREKVQYYEEITSTNDVLKKMAAAGAPNGTVLIADHQTSGRGRRGRSFLSPSGVGIYMSVLLRPNCKPSELMHLTCATASAICDAIENSVGFRPQVKWTNDLVYKKRKLAGILTELGFTAAGDVDYAIIGIGVNCCQTENDFDPSIREIAGSLSMITGKAVERALVAAAMVDAMWHMSEKLLLDHKKIMNQYRHDCMTVGMHVSVCKGNSVRHGLALDIDDDGGLIVQFDSGETETVNSGEVSVRGMYGYV